MEYINNELRENGISPKTIDIMVSLTKEPDDMQIISMEMFKLREEKEALKERMKVMARATVILRDRLDEANEKIKLLQSDKDFTLNNTFRYLENMQSFLEELVSLDTTESAFIEELKDIQNKASWIAGIYKLMNEMKYTEVI
ncbi:MAG TPA: hypothetical protein DCM59_16635 [Clostridium sp.]|nr:hypothetical protein [Clostridium sp.]